MPQPLRPAWEPETQRDECRGSGTQGSHKSTAATVRGLSVAWWPSMWGPSGSLELITGPLRATLSPRLLPAGKGTETLLGDRASEPWAAGRDGAHRASAEAATEELKSRSTVLTALTEPREAGPGARRESGSRRPSKGCALDSQLDAHVLDTWGSIKHMPRRPTSVFSVSSTWLLGKSDCRVHTCGLAQGHGQAGGAAGAQWTVPMPRAGAGKSLTFQGVSCQDRPAIGSREGPGCT